LVITGAVFTGVGSLILARSLTSSARADDDLERAKARGPDALDAAHNQHEYDELFTGIGAAHLAIGVPMILIGLLAPRYVYVRNHVSLSVVPVVTPERAGGTLTVAF
jgi:hypothetical protein